MGFHLKVRGNTLIVWFQYLLTIFPGTKLIFLTLFVTWFSALYFFDYGYFVGMALVWFCPTSSSSECQETLVLSFITIETIEDCSPGRCSLISLHSNILHSIEYYFMPHPNETKLYEVVVLRNCLKPTSAESLKYLPIAKHRYIRPHFKARPYFQSSK